MHSDFPDFYHVQAPGEEGEDLFSWASDSAAEYSYQSPLTGGGARTTGSPSMPGGGSTRDRDSQHGSPPAHYPIQLPPTYSEAPGSYRAANANTMSAYPAMAPGFLSSSPYLGGVAYADGPYSVDGAMGGILSSGYAGSYAQLQEFHRPGHLQQQQHPAASWGRVPGAAGTLTHFPGPPMGYAVPGAKYPSPPRTGETVGPEGTGGPKLGRSSGGRAPRRRVGAKGAVCQLCPDVAFHRANDLKRHMHSCHSSARPFVCAICDKTFKRNDVLKRHQSRPHTMCYQAGEGDRAHPHLGEPSPTATAHPAGAPVAPLPPYARPSLQHMLNPPFL